MPFKTFFSNYWWSKKSRHCIIFFCGHHSIKLRLLESTNLEGSLANILSSCPYYFSIFMGIPYAFFCVWYAVSSLHSIYFTVIQLLLRMINGKRENYTPGPFFSVHTMNCWAFWKQHQVCNRHDMCGTVGLWYKCTFNHCVFWLLIASKNVALWWINLWDCTNFESLTVVQETMVFKWRGLQNDTMLLI